MNVDLALNQGFKLRPTDKEMINIYLKKKKGLDSNVDDFIATIDLYKCQPWDLPDMSKVLDAEEWYFFRWRTQLRVNGRRFKRKIESGGYWKSTCDVKKILDKETNEIIAEMWTLVYHTPSDQRTNWIIHEYALCGQEGDSYVIFRLKYKKENEKKNKKRKNSKENKADTPESKRRKNKADTPRNKKRKNNKENKADTPESKRRKNKADTPGNKKMKNKADTPESLGSLSNDDIPFDKIQSSPDIPSVYSEGHNYNVMQSSHGNVDTELDKFYVPEEGFGGTGDGVPNDHGIPLDKIQSSPDIQAIAEFESFNSECHNYEVKRGSNGNVDKEWSMEELMDMFCDPQDDYGQPKSTETSLDLSWENRLEWNHEPLSQSPNTPLVVGNESSGNNIASDSKIPEPPVPTPVVNVHSAVEPLHSLDSANKRIDPYSFNESDQSVTELAIKFFGSPDENYGEASRSLDIFSCQPITSEIETADLPEGVGGVVNFPVHQLWEGSPIC